MVSHDHGSEIHAGNRSLSENSTAASNALRTLGDSTLLNAKLTVAQPKATDAQAQFLTYVNALASFLEPGQTFTDLNSVEVVQKNASNLEENKQ